MIESGDGMSSSEDYGGFSQFGDSLKGMVIGFILFPLALFIIFKVETCEQASDVFKKALPVSEAKAGKPAYVTGKLKAAPVGSQFVKPGDYISVAHSTEVYSPYEEQKTEGSGTNKKKVRRCKYKWMNELKPASSFRLSGCKKEREKIRRDNLRFPDSSNFASAAKVKAGGKSYSVQLKEVNFTGGVSAVAPASGQLLVGSFYKSGEYLYTSAKCAESTPLLGCERIKVRVIPTPSGDMTFIGDIKGSNIQRFATDDGKYLSAGLGDFKQTMGEVKSDDSTMKKIGYFICFLMVWASFSLFAGPLTTLVDFIPFVGEMGKTGINLLLGGVAFIITALTILIIKLWWLWILLILGGIGFGIYKRKNQASA